MCRIRTRYPNRRGTPYVGFIAAPVVAEGEYDSEEEQMKNYNSVFNASGLNLEVLD